MSSSKSNPVSRRTFLGAAAAATFAAPAIATAKKTNSQIILGSGEHQYEVHHDCVTLPKEFNWQVTHNVAVDSEGLLYVIHEGKKELADHPAIFVFDAEGKYIRSFGNQFQGGGHGLEIRHEAGQDFLYVTGYQHLKTFAKLDTKGETVWQKYAPMQSGIYAEGEATKPDKTWGRDRFMPTNFAFLPDGGFLLADGYGGWCIHRYDSEGNWISKFGSPGKADGQFSLPHGLWIDDRAEGEPTVVVADRANARLQWFTLAGEHLRTQNDFVLPANVDIYQSTMLVPDLQSRVTLLDGDNQIIAHLGDDPDWTAQVKSENTRTKPATWQAGKFVHPHDACFDKQGNIIVAEWVATGRITKLRRV